MSTILSMAPYAIAYTMPILITALGGMFSERSGIINLALDGIMTLGGRACSASVCSAPRSAIRQR